MQLSDRIGRRMKLHDLHVLMAVVECGSMSKAAQRLNTTQPAVSRSIADLEHALGVRLLDRGRHGAEPTLYGRALLEGGAAMFDDLRQAVKNIEFLADPTAGEVRVVASDPVIVGVLPAALNRLHRKYPGVSVQVTPTVSAARQYRDLRERKFDLFLGRVSLPVEEDLQLEVLFHDRMAIVAGPASKWNRRKKIALSELTDEPWVLPRLDSSVGPLVADAFRAQGASFPPKGAVWGAASVMCALLRRGRRIGCLPDSLLRFGVGVSSLKVLAVNLPIPRWPVGVLTLKNRTLTPVVGYFIDCVREVVRPLATNPGGR